MATKRFEIDFRGFQISGKCAMRIAFVVVCRITHRTLLNLDRFAWHHLMKSNIRTLYRYAGVMRDISEICDRSIALYGLNGQVCVTVQLFFHTT